MTHNTVELTMIFIYCNIFFSSYNSCSSFIWFLCHTHTIYVPFLIHLCSHSLCVRSYRFQILTFKINIHMQFTTKRETLFFFSLRLAVLLLISLYTPQHKLYASATPFVHLVCICARVCVHLCDGICVGECLSIHLKYALRTCVCMPVCVCVRAAITLTRWANILGLTTVPQDCVTSRIRPRCCPPTCVICLSEYTSRLLKFMYVFSDFAIQHTTT